MGGRRTVGSLCAASLALLLAAPPSGAQGAEPGGRCLGRRATIVGSDDDDRIRGTKGPDVILALGGDDVVLGGDGSDRICGGAGIDELHGRYGADRIVAGGSRDVVDGGPGGDLLIGGRGADRLSGGDGRGDTIVGGRGRDSLLGGDGRFDEDFLFGGDDVDLLDGGIGRRDRLFGGEGNDHMAEGIVSYEFSAEGVVVDASTSSEWGGWSATGEGRDRGFDPEGFVGSDVGDVITGSDRDSVLRGRGGDDLIFALGGDDTVEGGPGSDRLDGGDGVDLVSFEDSPAGVVANLLDGDATGAGTDSLTGFEDVEGSYFDDRLTGDDGPNQLFGSFGVNEIYGLAGNDGLYKVDAGDAGPGSDMCEGSAENCEGSLINDYIPVPSILQPEQGASLDHLGVVRGNHHFYAPGEVDVVVAIRRMTPNGCRWWDDGSERFVLGACGTPLPARTRLRDSEWVLTVDAALAPGAYDVMARFANQIHWVCPGAYAPSCVHFDVR